MHEVVPVGEVVERLAIGRQKVADHSVLPLAELLVGDIPSPPVFVPRIIEDEGNVATVQIHGIKYGLEVRVVRLRQRVTVELDAVRGALGARRVNQASMLNRLKSKKPVCLRKRKRW